LPFFYMYMMHTANFAWVYTWGWSLSSCYNFFFAHQNDLWNLIIWKSRTGYRIKDCGGLKYNWEGCMCSLSAWGH
jgi:hypothetical protein